jgi:HD-like signal output (HDOD) protein
VLSDVEQDKLGTTHTEVGAWLMNKWRLPPMFEEVIANLYRFSGYRGPYKNELAVVALANSISRLAGFGARVDWEGSTLEPALLETLKITEEHVGAVLEIVERSREETKQLLDYMD